MTDPTSRIPVVPMPSEIHPSLRRLFLPDGHVVNGFTGTLYPIALSPEDPLWIDQHAPREYPADAPGETGPEERSIVHIYSLVTGDRLLTNNLPSSWWKEHLSHITREERVSWQHRPNTWLVTSHYLLVNGGLWWRTPAPEGTLRYLSQTALRDHLAAEGNATQARWAAEYADAIEALRPSWADDVEFYGVGERPEGLTFARTIGAARIYLEYTLPDVNDPPHPAALAGGFYPVMTEPRIELPAAGGDGLTATEALGIAHALQNAATLLLLGHPSKA